MATAIDELIENEVTEGKTKDCRPIDVGGVLGRLRESVARDAEFWRLKKEIEKKASETSGAGDRMWNWFEGRQLQAEETLERIDAIMCGIRHPAA